MTRRYNGPTGQGAGKMGREQYENGKSDGASGADKDPPGGTGWVQDVENQVGGESDADRDYRDGYEDGQASR